MDLEESVVIDLTQFGSDDSTGYSGFYDHDEVSIVSAQFPNKRTKMEPKTSTNTSYGHLEDDLPESVAPTSAYTEMPGTSNTIMVITEGRGVASEIAYSFIDLNTTQCIVSQFADSASYSRIIYTILTTRPQLVLVPNAMAEWKSKAIVNIRRYLPWLTVAPLARALFSDAKGIRKLQELVVPAQAAPLVRIMAKKQYASAAFNAMIEHLEDNLDLTFVDGSINVKFRQMEGTMQIDPGAWRDLGLDSYAKTSGKSEPTLYSAINHTYTKMGSRLLRANILQPLTDLSTIYARQNAVLEILDTKKAVFKVFDKLFVRMNNDDNIIANESTFLREMHDISYILCNYDQHSLIAIDELGRSTNTREGKAICRAICEEFLDCSTTVFLSTHFLDLPEVLEVHSNCKTIVLSQDLNVSSYK
ncbi:MutS protein msh4 [Coemansia sp. RSA 1843]|nr:MutS protein msh4 [Coemansia sp. RSA 1843]